MDAVELLALILLCFLEKAFWAVWSKINHSISLQVPVNKGAKKIKKFKKLQQSMSQEFLYSAKLTETVKTIRETLT